jgi:hypothetical protein
MSLSNDQLKAASPAIFARRASKRVSERYGFIPTADMVKAFREAGVTPMQAAGQRSYKGGDNNVFGRHMIRFASSAAGLGKVGEVIPQVVLYNSHNGRTTYRLIAGLFRLVCSNGMTVAFRDFGSVEVRHNADALVKVIDASERIIANAREATKVIPQMRGLHMTERVQLDYARHALRLRYGRGTAPVDAKLLLEAKRPQDEGADLWHVFNRVQENITRGGMQGQALTGRRLTVRPLTNIRRDIAVNLDLWGMTMKFMQQQGKTPAFMQ